MPDYIEPSCKDTVSCGQLNTCVIGMDVTSLGQKMQSYKKFPSRPKKIKKKRPYDSLSYFYLSFCHILGSNMDAFCASVTAFAVFRVHV